MIIIQHHKDINRAKEEDYIVPRRLIDDKLVPGKTYKILAIDFCEERNILGFYVLYLNQNQTCDPHTNNKVVYIKKSEAFPIAFCIDVTDTRPIIQPITKEETKEDLTIIDRLTLILLLLILIIHVAPIFIN